MDELIRFAILGFGLGAMYSLAAQGLMVVYRGSGVLNFAHGAIGMVGAYVEWEVRTNLGQPFVVSVVLGVLASAALGAAMHLGLMRPLRHASSLARIVATLGVLIALQGITILRYGSKVTFVESELPSSVIEVFGLAVPVDRLWLLGIAVVLTVALWAIYRYTRFGIATTAVAENQRAASALGLSPEVVATLNWALGSALAGFAAILVAPIVTLQVNTMTTLVLAAMAAALVASFRSFPIAFAAGMGIGITQTELSQYTQVTGLAQSAPFIVIVGVLLLRGRGLPLRDALVQRLPAVGSGRVRVVPVVVAVALATVLVGIVPTEWQDSFVTTFATAVLLLSIVVVTGYAGQLSLGQFAIAGFGAWVAGRAVDGLDWSFLPALLLGVVATVPLGVLFAVPAVRSRGVNLAIVTLGLGTALELMLFNNGNLVGGFSGTEVGKPTLFGLDINAVEHPDRYAWVCLGFFVLAALAVASMRRGRSGRRLLAVRTNERAAAALGISVVGAKLYAFALAAGIAALGGVLLGFQKDTINYASEFTSFSSISAVAWAFIGGIGSILGPLIGATLAPGSVGAQVANAVFSDDYIRLASGIILLVLVLGNQDGSVNEIAKQLRALGRLLRRVVPRRGTAPKVQRIALPEERRERVPATELSVTGLTVRYGGVTAVDDVSFTVRPGAITGLIGPNGAGKTSVIDAITGFTSVRSGGVRLAGEEISALSPVRRARAGLSRSFQSLELFEDATVYDNLRAASDPRDRWSYLTDLVHPATPPLPGHVVAAIREFRLEDDLHRTVQDLSYGQRRLLAIARAVATRPSVLLLDEPAAGLDSVESMELARLVRRLADEWGIAVLLVEHDMSFVMGVCDELVVLDFGRKIAEGRPEVVRRDPTVIAAYLGETDEPEIATAGVAR